MADPTCEEDSPRPGDVAALLESSRVNSPAAGAGYMAGAMVILVLASLYAASRPEPAWVMLRGAAAMGMLGLLLLMAHRTWLATRGVRRERERLVAIEELLQLRRWPEAAAMLDETLSRPMRTPQGRAQALIYLGSVLSRYHRFADAAAVYEHLLETEPMDEPSAHALRLGRAMAMLRDDRLYDADRAISELRRSPQVPQSGGLALLEIYRDVKTGHPQEAVELFEQKLAVMRQQLGVRVGDAHVLAARAYDLLGRGDQAASHYLDATTLCPLEELRRRYPEVAALEGRYPPAARPAEVQP